MRSTFFLIVAAASVALLVQADAQQAGHSQTHPTPATGRPKAPGPWSGSTTPSVAFAADGTLWAVWADRPHVFAARSLDRGRTFGHQVQLTRQPEDLDANGESRTKIAIGPGGEVYATWTKAGARPHTGHIRFTRSVDGGKSFAAPISVNSDPNETGHRFDALHVGPTGTVYVAWIDKRDLDLATARGVDYAGAALYFATSSDRGATFAANRKIKDHICECCRLAVDFDKDVPVLVWRDVIDGVRDHGIVRFSSPTEAGTPRRATHDGWRIDACPHHGPSLSIAADGTHHLVWFTGEGPQGPGMFYARSRDGGTTFPMPKKLDGERPGNHAVVLSRGSRVTIAYREPISPHGARIMILTSTDNGASWAAPVERARTDAISSDFPFLVARGDDAYLSWFTPKEGLRVLPVRQDTTTTAAR